MSILNNAEDLKMGDVQVLSAFQGEVLVWPTITGPVSCCNPTQVCLEGFEDTFTQDPIPITWNRTHSTNPPGCGYGPEFFFTENPFYGTISLIWNRNNGGIWEIEVVDEATFSTYYYTGGSDECDPLGIYTGGITLTATNCVPPEPPATVTVTGSNLASTFGMSPSFVMNRISNTEYYAVNPYGAWSGEAFLTYLGGGQWVYEEALTYAKYGSAIGGSGEFDPTGTYTGGNGNVGTPVITT